MVRDLARLARSRSGVVLGFVAVAAAMLPFADLEVRGRDPWGELGRLALGLLRPDFSEIDHIAWATTLTLAFALLAVTVAAALGLALAPFYRLRPVRWVCVALRSVHELFWALIFMQVFGLGVTTGLLAIGLPYVGIFAKVYAEYLDATDPGPRAVLPPKTSALSAFLFARLPLAAREIATYWLYRIECGIRSSAVLGFVGLPTLGFQLDTFFKQGRYGAVAAILLIYFAVIASIRLWLRRRLLLVWLAAAAVALARVESPPMGGNSLVRFLTHDIVPKPLRDGDFADLATWARFARWLADIVTGPAAAGVVATLIVAQLALVLTGLVAVLAYPAIVRGVVGRTGALIGHIGLVVVRSSPEYMLAYVFLQILGPSMLPLVLALALHNGAIIGHLLGRQASGIAGALRPDAPRGFDLWAWELTPRLTLSFLALCLYRWEIILRESAIVGLLGVATLGFYVDDAVAELKMDRVVVLLAMTAGLTGLIDALSARIRRAVGVDRLTLGPAPATAERSPAPASAPAGC